MPDSNSQHKYTIGDAVLVSFGPAEIPGVIEADENGKFLVRIAQPWADETGNKTDTVWVEPSRLTAFINEETGSEQALPKS